MSEPNFRNRTLFIGDNLDVLRGMNSECVDLIYLDPPFNSKREYRAPIGTKAEGQKFDDTWRWTDLDESWLGEIDRRNEGLGKVIRMAMAVQGDGTGAYLAMMGIRLLELHRVLKPTGSIYLHCDPTASHYLKVCMDAVFGMKNFRNELIWGYEKPRPAKHKWRANHDDILFYAKDGNTFNVQRVPKMDGTFEMRKPFKRPDGTVWKPKEPGKAAGSWWYDIPSFATRMSAKERTGWATQKPLKLLQRIIKASSNPGDLVLDPFAGCATACVAAEMEGRRWVGIEKCEAGADIVQVRLDEAKHGRLGSESATAEEGKASVRNGPPNRTDGGDDDEDLESKGRKWSRKDKDTIFGRQRGKCAGCDVELHYRNLTVDHIVPKSKRGTDDLRNLALLCGSCNSRKGNRMTIPELRERNRAENILR